MLPLGSGTSHRRCRRVRGDCPWSTEGASYMVKIMEGTDSKGESVKAVEMAVSKLDFQVLIPALALQLDDMGQVLSGLSRQ